MPNQSQSKRHFFQLKPYFNTNNWSLVQNIQKPPPHPQRYTLTHLLTTKIQKSRPHLRQQAILHQPHQHPLSTQPQWTILKLKHHAQGINLRPPLRLQVHHCPLKIENRLSQATYLRRHHPPISLQINNNPLPYTELHPERQHCIRQEQQLLHLQLDSLWTQHQKRSYQPTPRVRRKESSQDQTRKKPLHRLSQVPLTILSLDQWRSLEVRSRIGIWRFHQNI